MNPLIQLKQTTSVFLVALGDCLLSAFTCRASDHSDTGSDGGLGAVIEYLNEAPPLCLR